jgi:rare lipoprotein A (peptidoglycan hydrolase)
MRSQSLKTYLLVLLALAAIAGGATADAFAETGGVLGAPSGPVTAIKPVALATWFGPGFYGRQTACGQTLTPAVVGVANRTLPCGTLVRFGYKGRTATVPVIDRGPYAHNGAQWDLTTGAASALGMADTARLHTRIVGSVPNTPTLGLPPASAAAEASLVTTGGAPAN